MVRSKTDSSFEATYMRVLFQLGYYFPREDLMTNLILIVLIRFENTQSLSIQAGGRDVAMAQLI